jgi:cell wall assembly regulator SMI1
MSELTLALLDALAARWRDAGAPVGESLRTGLDREAASALTAPLGCALPPEALTWWGWQDGTTGNTTEYMAWPAMWLVPLATSVERSRSEWDEFVSINGEEKTRERFWKPTWLPILETSGGDYIVIDCAEQETTSAVRFFDREGGGPANFEALAPSIATLVTWWIEGIDSGACWWDSERRLWMKDHRRLDPDNSKRGLV